jgi:4-aminobutyrate aminotransferase-like enzyme
MYTFSWGRTGSTRVILQLQSSVVPALPSLLPELVTAVPGPRSRALARRLAAVESRNVTCTTPLPIFWERASGSNVWDVDGNRYVDLTAGFGVANCGHAHPAVSSAVARQAEQLMHGMGDVHPASVKVELLEALVERFPGGEPALAVLGSSGADAVETALETALLASGSAGVVAFEGAYHGLSLGTRDVTWRPMFRDPFAERLADRTAFARFGDIEDVARAARTCPAPVGAILVEPIQGRGGERIPPDGFLHGLRALCDEQGWLLIVDEIYTGFGRTGHFFACEYEGVVPDLLCVAKGLTSGMPLSACLGRTDVMNAWPVSQGEALRTQTFLGHPPGCAAGLASIETIERERLVERSARNGSLALSQLKDLGAGRPGVIETRGRGLLLAVELDTPQRASAACRNALASGVIVLQSGDDGRVLSISPPLSIEPDLLALAIEIVMEAVQ